jgi:hypothetical protein
LNQGQYDKLWRDIQRKSVSPAKGEVLDINLMIRRSFPLTPK